MKLESDSKIKGFIPLGVACAVAVLVCPGVAVAEPDPDPAPPPDTGVVASEPPTVTTTPDGWVLTVAASGETQLAIAPLTTALSSREYLAGATFTGSVTGSGTTTLDGGTLETGYQIGCGIAADKIKLNGSVGLSTSGSTLGDLVPTGLSVPIQGQIEVELKPGDVNNVVVNKKTFTGTEARVTIKDIHIKIDSCVGQSFLRSYAVLTSVTADTKDVVVYYGVTKAV